MPTNSKQTAKAICKASNNIFSAGNACKRLFINDIKLKNDLLVLNTFFETTNNESFLIAGIIYNRLSTDDSMSIRDILRWLNLQIDSAPDIQEVLNNLYKKGLIGRETNRWEKKEPQYFLTPGAYQAVISGKRDEINTYSINSFLDILQRVYQLFNDLRSDKCEAYDYYFQIEHLIEQYQHFQEIQWLKQQDISSSDELILITAASFAASSPRREINIERIIQYTDSKSLQIIQEFTNNTHPLLNKKLLEFVENDFSSVDEMKLTSFTVEGFGLIIRPKSINLNNLKYGTILQPDQITSFDVYVNPKEQKHLETIEKIYNKWFPLCIPAEEIVDTMKSLKIMMEGPSGVGKSQSILNFAKRNGIAIYEARASQMKDMWVGSTEKAYEGIFNEFRVVQEFNAERGVGTIMVINELEGILASRIKSDSSVNFMISSATSIFLKELERFKGILITTCNQSKGFVDEAAYRRFNFKVKFDEPTFVSRLEIAKSKFPNLNIDFLKKLCVKFNLRGGQLQNVFEKFKIISLTFDESEFENLVWELCEEEVAFIENSKSLIGFKSNY